jgi:hypothetical protein
MTRRIEESEGHVAEFAASLLPEKGALAAPNLKAGVFLITATAKGKISKALACLYRPKDRSAFSCLGRKGSAEQCTFNASRCQNAPNGKPLAGFSRLGADEKRHNF